MSKESQPYPDISSWRERARLREPLSLVNGIVMVFVSPHPQLPHYPGANLIYCLKHKSNIARLIRNGEWGLPSESRNHSFATGWEDVLSTGVRCLKEEINMTETQAKDLIDNTNVIPDQPGIEIAFRYPARAMGAHGDVLVGWIDHKNIELLPTTINTEEIFGGAWFSVNQILNRQNDLRFRQYPDTIGIIQELFKKQYLYKNGHNTVPWSNYYSLKTS